MKKSTIITIIAFVLGIVVLTTAFILLTDNNISKKFKPTTTVPSTTPTTAPNIYAYPAPDYTTFDFLVDDVTQWVTLGQCRDLVVDVDKMEITEEDIDLQLHIILCQKDLHSKKLSGTIEEKNIFSFDYTGYLLKEDGTTRDKEMSNGKATGQLAYIDGNDLITLSTSSSQLGGLIDGFAQGMLGMSVGESKTLKITFPEVYPLNPDMAGKKVEFDVKVNYIAQTNFDDDTAKHISNNKYNTVSEYKENLRKELEDSLEYQNKQIILSKILDNVTIIASAEKQTEYIFSLLCAKVESYVDQYASFGYKITFGEALKNMGGYNSIDELRKYAQEVAASDEGQLAIKQNTLLYAIIVSEQIEMTEEDYNTELEKLSKEMNKTVDKLYEEYTEEFIRIFLKERILLDKAEKSLEDMIATCECVLKNN